MRTVLAMSFLCAALGCPRSSTKPPPSSTTPTPTAPSATTPEPVPPSPPSPVPPTPEPSKTAWVGSWTSASCGARAYERRITLAADGTVNGEERVSPCPAGKVCVWSGIVPFSGTYQKNGKDIALKVSAQGGPAVSLPAKLEWDEAGERVVEPGSGGPCQYQRAS